MNEIYVFTVLEIVCVAVMKLQSVKDGPGTYPDTG